MGEARKRGRLACASTRVVTRDGITEVSEAVAGSASVFVFPLPGRSRRITRFLQGLEAAGRIRMLEPESPAQRLTPWVAAPLDDTPELIAEMHRRLGF